MRLSASSHAKQNGLVMVAMLAILVTGAAAVLVGTLNKTALQNSRQATTSLALAQAREALIGYAITYGDTHSGQTHGYLPCPDPNGISAGIADEGSSETCGSKNVSAIGRLPWKSLELPEQRDGTGECLWYAVSGTHKNNPKTDLMNWDTSAQFELVDASGNLITSNVVAVIFAAGAPLRGQIRTSDGSAPACGGNYTTGNYLDNDATLGVNNATPSTVAKASSRIIAASSSQDFNDQLTVITSNDLFDKIKRRNDFSTFVATLLSNAATCLSGLPNPVNINFDTLVESTGTSVDHLIIGRIPYTACSDNLVRQWRDNLLYAKCTSGECKVNGIECGKNGIVIFTGERSAGQVRNSSADKSSWNNYLEGVTFSMFSTGASRVTGAAVAYNPASPSTDIAACIP